MSSSIWLKASTGRRLAVAKSLTSVPSSTLLPVPTEKGLSPCVSSYMLTNTQVGGSSGFVSIHLASAFPFLHFTVQDLAQALGDGAAKVPPTLKDRVEFMAYDFLTPQPIHGADVYLFRWIFHNWSDLYCLRILRNLAPALKKGALVLINDNVLPEPGTLGQWQEERLR